MENSPLTPTEEDGDKQTTGKKKKKAEALGLFAVKPKEAAPKQAESSDLWQKLSLTKRKGGESIATIPLAELSEISPDQVPEAGETEAPLESLSPTEEQFVEREIISAQQQAETAESVDQPETAAEAVDLFRDKIVHEGQPVEQAFAETLQILGVEPETALAEEMPEAGEPAIGVQQPAARETSAVGWQMPEVGAPETEELSVEAEPAAGGAGGSAQGGGFNFAPVPPAPAAPATTEAVRQQKDNGGEVMNAALIGGIIGYLIGRRRGRIKTQKKLLPIQKKLETQVANLKEDIQRKEFYIRKVARDKNRDQMKIAKMEQASKKSEQEQTRPVAMEANQLHGKVAPERIGHMLVGVNETAKSKAEKAPEKPKPPVPLGKRVETLSRTELLDLSQNITVENTNLRRVYETHLVSEQGLRHLVSEYLQGKDVQKALRAELVEHEIDFERDPVLRDSHRSKPEVAASSPTLSTLLQKAGVDTDKDHSGISLPTKELYDQDERELHLRHRRFMDFALLAIIFILLLLVLALTFSRR